MSFDDKGPGATEKVFEEVTKDLNSRFRFRQVREFHAVHIQLHRFRTETEFEAGACITMRTRGCIRGEDLQLDLYPFLFLGRVDVVLFFGLGPSFDGMAVSIIPDYGGDLWISGLVLLSRETAT